MINIVLKQIGDFVKKTFLFRKSEWLYGKLVNTLFSWKWIARLLAHGGIHFILLILLLCQAIYMWIALKENNVTSFNQICYCFYGDTLHNYQLNYLHFEKDLRRRKAKSYNKNDIQYSFGFTKNQKSTKKSQIRPIKYKNFNAESDLVAKVRYITINDIPDSIDQRKPYNIHIGQQIYRTKYVSNHERLYYNISTIQDSLHIFHRDTHAKDHLIEWDKIRPFFSCWIGIILEDSAKLNDKSLIRIKLNDFEKEIPLKGYRRPLIIEKVYPQPTKSNILEIVYEGEQLNKVIEQRGIYISGVDPEKKELVEKKNLRSTVLLGTIIAFILDIMVQLVLKWRKLKKYKQ